MKGLMQKNRQNEKFSLEGKFLPLRLRPADGEGNFRNPPRNGFLAPVAGFRLELILRSHSDSTLQEVMPPLSTVVGTTFVMLNIINLSNPQDLLEIDLEFTLDCHRRSYTHKVTQSDPEGRVCWDMVTVMSCWGRCDSNEISDWKFPYKRSHHPVCIHGERQPKTVILGNCEEGAHAGTEVHEYMEAISCQCSLCKSSEANCEGVRYRGEKSVLSFQSD